MIEVAHEKALALTTIGSSAVFFDTGCSRVYQLQIPNLNYGYAGKGKITPSATYYLCFKRIKTKIGGASA